MLENEWGGMPGEFDFFEILFMVFAIIVLGLILFTIIKNLSTWIQNNNSPVVDAPAKVVSKRTRVSGGGERKVSNHYYLTFELQSGERIELQVKGQDYGQLVEGDKGVLQYQGTRYLGFARGKSSAF